MVFWSHAKRFGQHGFIPRTRRSSHLVTPWGVSDSMLLRDQVFGTKCCDSAIKSVTRNMSLSPRNVFYARLPSLHCSAHPLTSLPFPQLILQEHTHTHAHVRLIQGILHRTRQEEQMSLSTEIKNHYFDSFTNSYINPSVEDKWQEVVWWWSEL